MTGTTLKYVRIVIGHNKVREVERVEPDEVSSYWWSKPELKKMRSDYREEVMMEGVRALVRDRLQLEEDDPAVIEDRADEIMAQPPRQIAAFLESAPAARSSTAAARSAKSTSGTAPPGGDDDDESVSSSTSSSSTSSSSCSSSSGGSSSGGDGDHEDDPILRRQKRETEEVAVSDSDIYALFEVNDGEDSPASGPCDASTEEGTDTSAAAPATPTRSTRKPPAELQRKQKPSPHIAPDGDDTHSSSSSSSDCNDESAPVRQEEQNVKPAAVEELKTPSSTTKQHAGVRNHRRHKPHHFMERQSPPTSASRSPPAPSPKKGAPQAKGRPGPTRHKRKKVLTAADRKALGDRFRQAVLAVMAMERLGAMVERIAPVGVLPTLRRESSLVDLYLPSDEERDEVNHRKMTRKKGRTGPVETGGGGCGGDDAAADDGSTHATNDDNTECPICLGLVQPAQHRKITLLRRMLCRKCFSVHYTSRTLPPPSTVVASPFHGSAKSSGGRVKLYRKNHHRSLSPKREAASRGLDPGTGAHSKSGAQAATIHRTTKSLSPTRRRPRAAVASGTAAENPPPGGVARKGGRRPAGAGAKAAAKAGPCGGSEVTRQRRVKSVSPGRLRSGSGDGDGPVDSKPVPVRKRGSSADPCRTGDAPPSGGRQSVRRGVRPVPVKAKVERKAAAKRDDAGPSAACPTTPVPDKESALEKKRRVKERLAKRRAQNRSDRPCRTAQEGAAASESPAPPSDDSPGLAAFLCGRVHPPLDGDDGNTIQSAPI